MNPSTTNIEYIDGNNIYRWSSQTLWQCVEGLEIEEMEVELFYWYFERDLWFQDKAVPTILNVIEHFNRILGAELEYPLILSPNGIIIDGIHRLVKAFINGHSRIKVVKLHYLPPSE